MVKVAISVICVHCLRPLHAHVHVHICPMHTLHSCTPVCLVFRIYGFKLLTNFGTGGTTQKKRRDSVKIDESEQML